MKLTSEEIEVVEGMVEERLESDPEWDEARRRALLSILDKLARESRGLPEVA